MKTIIIDGVEYVPKESNWTKQVIEGKTLEWGEVSEERMNWEEAKAWCEKQGGRLPTSAELLTAYETKVEGFMASYYWSATTYPNTGSQDYAIYVNFKYGDVSHLNKTFSSYVRCVRG